MSRGRVTMVAKTGGMYDFPVLDCRSETKR